MASTLKNNLDLSNDERGGNTAFLLCLIRQKLPKDKLAIAVSGGLDSMALLNATLTVAREHGVTLLAFYVHHGLHAQADEWLRHVEQFCLAHQIEFAARHLDANTRKNAQSIEEWARQGRYAALAEMAVAHSVKEVWLAQHEDDQIETYVLQHARGAGARGLSAMPAMFYKNGLRWQRPWLSVTRAQIASYVAEQQLAHIHDPSNDDLRFARNSVRLDVQKISSNERARILEAIAVAQNQTQQEDVWAQQILDAHRAPHRPEIGECSRLVDLHLSDYSVEQRAILLRAWFASMNWRMPSRATLADLCRQLLSDRVDQHMCWRHGDGFAVARFQNAWIAACVLPMGQWFLTEDLQQWVQNERLTLRTRIGGERIRFHPQRSRMSLKQAYQEKSVAPMLRGQLPLIYRGDELIYVVGVGANVDAPSEV